MPYRNEQFTNDGICHTIIRGIDDKVIFKDKDDYFRGIFSIYEFNDFNPVEIWRRRRDRIAKKKKEKMWDVGRPTFPIRDKRDRFVDILCFCFMPNHLHLLLKQIRNGGIQKFMTKLGSGYGRYFNQKYQRKGYVFQNRFRSVLIKSDNQLMNVVNYIHANPISLIEPHFKEQGIKNHSVQEVIDFLKGYKWSSFQDYIGIKNFPTVTERDFILEVMDGENGLMENLKDWIIYKKYLGQYDDIFLE